MSEIPGDHRYGFPEDGTRWAFLFLLIRPDFIRPNWEEAKRRLGETPYLPGSSRPVRLLQTMWEEASEGRITDPYIASSFVYQFISELCRYAAAPQGRLQEWPEKIRQAVEYMNANYDRMISLDELSDKLGMSKYHFVRVFAAATGTTPNNYLNRIRVGKAVDMLSQTDWSVERIAEQLGFSSGSYFIKVFRKMTGRTPGSVRARAGQMGYAHFYFD